MRALSCLLYKDNAFFGEIQIALIFEYSHGNVKMQRFAADGVGRVLYYGARTAGRLSQGPLGGDPMADNHCFCPETGGAGLADGNFFR